MPIRIGEWTILFVAFRSVKGEQFDNIYQKVKAHRPFHKANSLLGIYFTKTYRTISQIFTTSDMVNDIHHHDTF
jgi:hypothetical protein